eukprot:gene6357-12856_t
MDEQDQISMFEGNAVVKVASVGMFIDDEWDAVYLVIRTGCLRIYASRSDFISNSGSFVFEMLLDSSHHLSEVISKGYSRKSNNKILIKNFFIFQKLGFVKVKLLKIGSLSEDVIMHIRRSISQCRETPASLQLSEAWTPLVT